jgi:hypothetical protein
LAHLSSNSVLKAAIIVRSVALSQAAGRSLKVITASTAWAAVGSVVVDSAVVVDSVAVATAVEGGDNHEDIQLSALHTGDLRLGRRPNPENISFR